MARSPYADFSNGDGVVRDYKVGCAVLGRFDHLSEPVFCLFECAVMCGGPVFHYFWVGEGFEKLVGVLDLGSSK